MYLFKKLNNRFDRIGFLNVDIIIEFDSCGNEVILFSVYKK